MRDGSLTYLNYIKKELTERRAHNNRTSALHLNHPTPASNEEYSHDVASNPDLMDRSTKYDA